MTRTSLRKIPCSFAQFAEVLGDKWSLLILRDALLGVKTFSGFERRLGVSKNILADRLGHLVKHGVLERRRTRPEVERFSYELTAKGRALFPVCAAIMQWSDKWVFGAEGEPVRVVDKASEAPIQTMAVMSRDGRFLELEDVSFAPGPGARSRKRAGLAV